MGSSRRISSRAVVDLPQPDSPTRPSVSPSSDVEGDAVDGLHGADLRCRMIPCGDREVLDEVADLDERLGVAGERRAALALVAGRSCAALRPSTRRRARSPDRPRGRATRRRPASSISRLRRWSCITPCAPPRHGPRAARARRLRVPLASRQATPCFASPLDRLERRLDARVRLAHVRAARVERAAARQRDQRRRAAGDRDELLVARRVQARDRAAAGPTCRGARARRRSCRSARARRSGRRT